MVMKVEKSWPQELGNVITETLWKEVWPFLLLGTETQNAPRPPQVVST